MEGRSARLVWTVVALICGVSLLSSGAIAGRAIAQGEPYGQASLALRVERKLVVGDRATVRATGTAPAPLVLSIFVDPRGRSCPDAAVDRPKEAKVIYPGLPVAGDFSVRISYRPVRRGSQTLCAYLGPSEGTPTVTATKTGTVHVALLRAKVARHTVPLALRRHGFAHRVVDALEKRCLRVSRNALRCRFSAMFPGYKLVGQGMVRLAVDGVSYRFRVRAQGVHVLLTDRNEQPASG